LLDCLLVVRCFHYSLLFACLFCLRFLSSELLKKVRIPIVACMFQWFVEELSR